MKQSAKKKQTAKEPARHVRQAQCRFWRYEIEGKGCPPKRAGARKGRRYKGERLKSRRDPSTALGTGAGAKAMTNAHSEAMTNAHRQECLCYSFVHAGVEWAARQ